MLTLLQVKSLKGQVDEDACVAVLDDNPNEKAGSVSPHHVIDEWIYYIGIVQGLKTLEQFVFEDPLLAQISRLFLFLWEIKLWVWEFNYRYNFPTTKDHFVVEPDGRCGRLALFWASNININLISYFGSHIEINMLDNET